MWTVRVTHGSRARDVSFDTKREAHRYAQSKRLDVQPSGVRKPGVIVRIGPDRKTYSVYSTGGR